MSGKEGKEIYLILYVSNGFSAAGANKLSSPIESLLVANCSRRRGAYSMQRDIVVVSADLGSTWNQPNHPEVLPMSAVNPIADVSL